jgi:hypothetical protein
MVAVEAVMMVPVWVRVMMLVVEITIRDLATSKLHHFDSTSSSAPFLLMLWSCHYCCYFYFYSSS